MWYSKKSLCGALIRWLNNPYSDQAEKWHNTKVYNLRLIKKLGIEKWAKEKAGGILDKYFYGTWTL